MNLHRHHFLSFLVGGKAAEIISAAGVNSKRPVLSPPQEYVRSVLFAASELVNTTDQMAYSVESLSGYREGRKRAEFDSTRLEHLVFHLENHLIRAIMLGDRALKLVNVVFALGLSERACSPENITNNGHVRNTDTGRALQQLHTLLKPKRSERNVVVHRRRLRDDGLERFEVYYLLKRSESYHHPERFTERYYPMVKAMTDRFVCQKRRELEHFNSESNTSIAALFDALSPVFERRHAELAGGTV